MKKQLFVSVLFLSILFSCNKDETVDVDPIVGKWQLEASFYNGSSEFLDDCDKQSELVINADGTFSGVYMENNDMGECEIDDQTTGTWENIDSDHYRVITPGESIIQNVTFPDGKLKWYNDDEEDYYEIWKRI